MFIPEREIWLKATAQAMVDLTILLRNTYLLPYMPDAPIHLSDTDSLYYYFASINMAFQE